MKTFLFLLTLTFSIHAMAQENWTDKIKVGGDLRIRHDYNKKEEQSARHRERFRLRLGVTAAINEKMTAKARLASSEDGDPISTNSTFTNNSSKKAAYIDLAFIDWKFMDGMSFLAGKQENILMLLPTSQLLFDTDYTPEGFALNLNHEGFFMRTGAFSLVERTPTAAGQDPDSWLLSGLLGYQSESSNGFGFLAAAGFHDFTNMRGNSSLYKSGTASFMGNSATGTDYTHGYQVAELIGEFHGQMGGQILSVFADLAMNTAVEEDNQAFLAGVSLTLPDEKDKPEWVFTYNYRSVNKDATASAINDSDFANGEDGSHGHTGVIGYAVANNANLNLSYYIANVDNNGSPYETHRGFVDLMVKF